MFVANLSPMAIGLVLLLGSMAAAVTITLVVVTALDRHNQLACEREFTAFAERLAAEIDDDWIEDDSAWDDPRDRAYEEDFAEWEVRSVEEADDRARMIELQRDLRICGDMVDELAEYLDVLHYHPLVAGAEDIPALVTHLDQLIDQEYQLVQATR